MITLQELCDYLEQLFDVSQFLDYCPNGLQVEGKTEIKKVATAVTAS
ncbi:MAG: Nif3-like dinuclear metal center hexameric protein, partial [Waddliaceae bacterium]